MRKIAQKFQDKPWKHGLLAAILFLLAYAAASWAIDSGRLTAYFLAVVLLVFGVKQTIKSIQKAYAK